MQTTIINFHLRSDNSCVCMYSPTLVNKTPKNYAVCDKTRFESNVIWQGGFFLILKDINKLISKCILSSAILLIGLRAQISSC